MYKENILEIKVEPCSTSIETGKGLEKLFLVITIWVRFVAAAFLG